MLTVFATPLALQSGAAAAVGAPTIPTASPPSTPADTAYRSTMNVVWRLPSEDLEKQFIAESTSAGLIGLKGHRSVGGIRASIYNACTTEAIDALIDFMKNFESRNG